MKARLLLGVCETALAASICLALGACLPDLDPARLVQFCVGGPPNGVLEGGEECDDGNDEDGDGCAKCLVECPAPALKAPGTNHCYSLVTGTSSGVDARDRCGAAGGRLVTIRSPEEEALVLKLLEGRPAEQRFHTAYEIDQGKGFGLFDEAVPYSNILSREPGLLVTLQALVTRVPWAPGEARACSGCFPSTLPAGFAKAARDRVAIAADGTRSTVSPSDGLAGGVCETLPLGTPQNLCPGVRCVSGEVSAELHFGGFRYTYHPTPKPRADAAKMCAGLNGNLWVIESEVEREQVVRYFGGSITAQFTWVGLKETVLRDAMGNVIPGSAWQWDDGIIDRGAGRPSYWSYDPGLPEVAARLPWDVNTTDSCASLVQDPSTFAMGLLFPGACGGTTATNTMAGSGYPTYPASQPFLCKAKL